MFIYSSLENHMLVVTPIYEDKCIAETTLSLDEFMFDDHS